MCMAGTRGNVIHSRPHVGEKPRLYVRGWHSSVADRTRRGQHIRLIHASNATTATFKCGRRCERHPCKSPIPRTRRTSSRRTGSGPDTWADGAEWRTRGKNSRSFRKARAWPACGSFSGAPSAHPCPRTWAHRSDTDPALQLKYRKTRYHMPLIIISSYIFLSWSEKKSGIIKNIASDVTILVRYVFCCYNAKRSLNNKRPNCLQG